MSSIIHEVRVVELLDTDDITLRISSILEDMTRSIPDSTIKFTISGIPPRYTLFIIQTYVAKSSTETPIIVYSGTSASLEWNKETDKYTHVMTYITTDD